MSAPVKRCSCERTYSASEVAALQARSGRTHLRGV